MLPKEIQKELIRCGKSIRRQQEAINGLSESISILTTAKNKHTYTLMQLEDQQEYLREGQLVTLQDMKDRSRRDKPKEKEDGRLCQGHKRR